MVVWNVDVPLASTLAEPIIVGVRGCRSGFVWVARAGRFGGAAGSVGGGARLVVDGVHHLRPGPSRFGAGFEHGERRRRGEHRQRSYVWFGGTSTGSGTTSTTGTWNPITVASTSSTTVGTGTSSSTTAGAGGSGGGEGGGQSGSDATRGETRDRCPGHTMRGRRARQTADVRLAYTEVKAPIDGIVDVRAARPGEVVNAGQPVVTLINPDDLWVRVDVEETYIDRVRIGDHIPVRLPWAAGRRRRVLPRVDAGFATQRDVSRTKRDIKTFEIRLRCDNKERRLAVGMTVSDAAGE